MRQRAGGEFFRRQFARGFRCGQSFCVLGRIAFRRHRIVAAFGHDIALCIGHDCGKRMAAFFLAAHGEFQHLLQNLPIEIENAGDTLWLVSRAAPKGTVRLGVKILNEINEVIDETHGSPPLPRAVAPGSCSDSNYQPTREFRSRLD